MRYVVAVSGGVDSVVLLDVLAQKASVDGDELIVAHFDHGIREESAADARFVRALAEKYELKYLSKRQELGKDVSENTARTHRYRFLRQVASENDAGLVTAHHRDDLVETIAINLHRGTGWRGLAVLAADDIARPLLSFSKQQIYQYALAHKLEWVEDETNRSDRYLRNRLRYATSNLSEDTEKRLSELRHRQDILRYKIDSETKKLIGQTSQLSRYLFIMAEPDAGQELLRTAIVTAGLLPPTRPQLSRALLAIKVARPGAKLEINGDITLDFTTNSFIVNTP